MGTFWLSENRRSEEQLRFDTLRRIPKRGNGRKRVPKGQGGAFPLISQAKGQRFIYSIVMLFLKFTGGVRCHRPFLYS